MSDKTRKIISGILIYAPAAMLLFSAIMKFIGAQQVVDGLTKVGFLGHFALPMLACIELLGIVLLVIPKTFKLGLFWVTAYLGGAAAIEITGGNPPGAFMFIALIWIGAYIRNKSIFLN
jgi:DoxX-like family